MTNPDDLALRDPHSTEIIALALGNLINNLLRAFPPEHQANLRGSLDDGLDEALQKSLQLHPLGTYPDEREIRTIRYVLRLVVQAIQSNPQS